MALSTRSRIRTAIIVAGSALVVFATAVGMLGLLGMPTARGVVFALVIAGLHALYTTVHTHSVTSGWFPSRARTQVLAAVWAGMIGVSVTGVVTAWTGGLGLVPLLGGLLGALATAPFTRRRTTTSATIDRPLFAQVRSLNEAEAALAAAEVRLADPTLSPERRAMSVIEHAEALTAYAVRARAPDRLDEIVDELTRLVVDGILDHGVRDHGLRLAAACALVGARNVQAEITRDAFGWDEALRHLTAIVEEPRPFDEEPAAAVRERGRYLVEEGERAVYEMRRAAERSGEALAPAEHALRCFRAALRALGEDAAFGPQLRFKISMQALAVARVDPRGAALISLPQEIAELRTVLRLHAGQRREGRAVVRRMLGEFLLLEADTEEQITPGLAEAESIGRRIVADRRHPELRGQGHLLLADAARLRLELTPAEDLPPSRRSALTTVVLDNLAAAFTASRDLSFGDASAAGRRWAEAVAATGDATATAAAYAQLVRQLPVDALRRLQPVDQAEAVATQQGIATEAGYWLTTAGKAIEAVDAIENARAILLGQRATRIPAHLETALRRADRPELYPAYTRAALELGERERALYDADTDADADAAHRARSRFDRVRREVADVVGPDLTQPGHGAARLSAPLVYVGAARRSGYAMAVFSDGRIESRRLPDAARANVEQRVADVRRFRIDHHTADAVDTDGLSTVLSWAWDAIMEPVTAMVADERAVTVVPLGGLGALPLHAAGRNGLVVDDVVAVRYAPSARMAQQALRDAEDAARRPPMVLAAGVVDPTLPLVDVETRWICGLGPAHRLPDATVAVALAALPAATVWHFACHGRADPIEPLDSLLQLADGPLTVRTILARPPGAYRLAVLSACETAVPDAARLDEVIGFPGALMQAGVAGVVASWWPVDDDAAAAFSMDLHERLATGAAPTEAVRDSRRWMRTVTRRELVDRFGPRFEAADTGLDGSPFHAPWHWGAFSLTGV